MNFFYLMIFLPVICFATGKTHKDWKNFQAEIDRVNSEDSYQELSMLEEQSIYKELELRKDKISKFIAFSDEKKEIINKKLKKYNANFNDRIFTLEEKVKEIFSPAEKLEYVNNNFNYLSNEFKTFVDENLKDYTFINRKIYKDIDKFTEAASKAVFDDKKKESYNQLVEKFKLIKEMAKERYNFAKKNIEHFNHVINEIIAEILSNPEISHDLPVEKAIENMLISQSAEIKPIDFSEKKETESFLLYAAQQFAPLITSEANAAANKSPELDKSALKPKSNKFKAVLAEQRTINFAWQIIIPHKMSKNLEAELDHQQATAFKDLAAYLKSNGPNIQSKDLMVGRFRNYGRLAKDLYHCHLGTSRKVAVWKADEPARKIIFYYIGKHPGDNYKQIKKHPHLR